jgi:4-diphosphocytidyl-2-C-methyl-D-erythritol kinase
VISARVVAQAKINLYLRVLAKETSGYHSIETVFLRLDLGDEVHVRVAAGRSLDVAGPAMPGGGLGPVEKNLAYRAAVVYADATGWPNGFSIEVDKRIPVGGGLGGGSADAGAVLRALDALSPHPIGSRLVELATPLGADVPFLSIESPMALAWGRGERLFPIRALDSRPILLAIPSFSIATADAYSWLSSDRGAYEPTAAVLTPESLATWESLGMVAENEFERVVARRQPLIGELVAELDAAGATLAMMSGSGSTVFGVFSSPVSGGGVGLSAGVTAMETRTAERVVRVELNG